jgi:RNA polymerase sigma-70 factor (ECF subfamily)
MDDPGRAAADAALTRVFREEAGHLTATLVRLLGDFDQAEDLVQDALLAALEHWSREGIPDRPGAWLLTAARRKAIDRWRREARYAGKLALLEQAAAPDAPPAEDDRLRLIFTCCNPALAREAQLALTLRAVCGLPTAAIARAFLTSEATVAQRIVRAKRKIVAAGIPFRVPTGPLLAARLDEVLAVLYLLFNEGYLASDGAAARPDLAEEAAWLAGLLHRLLPDEPEVLGLLALLRVHQARAAARFDGSGRLVLLRDQDRARWDHAAIAAASALIVEATQARRPGPYQIQAAIAACHAEAPTWEATDWVQIFMLYHTLYQHQPAPVVRLNRAIALRYVVGPAPALVEVEALAGALAQYHLYHATHAELLRALGRPDEARAADARALALTANPAERALLAERLF